jgi:hypothetical protein
MGITLDELRNLERDYFLARWENEELVMEPHCCQGHALEDQYQCNECDRKCMCTFIVCQDSEALAKVESLLRGNPDFRKFEVASLD